MQLRGIVSYPGARGVDREVNQFSPSVVSDPL